MIFKNKKYQIHFITIFALLIYLSAMFYFTVSKAMQKSSEWQNNLSSNVTIELPYDMDIDNAVKEIRSIPAVKVAFAMEEENKEKILKEWISNLDISEIPISNIVEVQIAEETNVDKLKEEVESRLEGAHFYKNSYWGNDILQISRLIMYMSIFLLLLIFIVSIVLVNFMVKSLLTTYSSELDILYLNGADDEFISNMICKSILKQSLKASVLALLGANITMYILSSIFDVSYLLSSKMVVLNVVAVLIISLATAFLANFHIKKELRD